VEDRKEILLYNLKTQENFINFDVPNFIIIKTVIFVYILQF